MAKRPGRKALRLETHSEESTNPVLKAQLDGNSKLDRLDITRSYGEVTGAMSVVDVDGVSRLVRYEQKAGKGQPSRLYDHDRVRILRPGESPAKTPIQAKADAAEARAAAPDEDDEDDDPPMDLSAIMDDETAGSSGDGEVNLTAWAEGLVKYRWAQIRNAIEERYGRVVNDAAEARDFLAEQGVGKVSPRNAKPELHAEE